MTTLFGVIAAIATAMCDVHCGINHAFALLHSNHRAHRCILPVRFFDFVSCLPFGMCPSDPLVSCRTVMAQDFDMESEFGAVVPGQVDGVIELRQRIGGPMAYHEFSVVNEYMGFADFRAAFTPETGAEWTVEPKEGSLSKQPVNFIVRFKPQTPGAVEGFLIIDTEDFKKTYKLVGSTL